MTNQPGYVPPNPEANRAEYMAAHPGAQPVDSGQAAEQVAAHLGGAAPDPGVSGEDLGAQMAAAGASPGLPHEDQMNALMDEIRRLSQTVTGLQERDQQRERAAIAALGEPILQRYANAVRDGLHALRAAHPGSDDHLRGVIDAADRLASVSADTISKGGNDMGQVMSAASAVDRFIERGHKRTATGHLRQMDLSTIGHHLEYLVEEAMRLAPGAVAIAGTVI